MVSSRLDPANGFAGDGATLSNDDPAGRSTA